jgi:hypothetical protein
MQQLQDRREPHGADQADRIAKQKLTRRDLEQARAHSVELKKVEDALRELLPRVTEEVASSGPRVLTPEMNRFLLLSGERARLRLTSRPR